MKKLVLIAVPYWLGEKTEYTGCVEAFAATGIAEEIGATWREIQADFSRYAPVIAVNKALASTLQNLSEDELPLIMAGDCTSCWGALKGLEAQNPDVLWYDAHGDFNTPETTPSGFLGGMPLAAAVGRGNQDLMQALNLATIVEEKITITDARDLDPEERIALANSGLLHLPDVRQVLNLTWENPLYIHFDADILPLNEYPAVSYPAQGGATVATVTETLFHALDHAPIAGILFSLWNQQLTGANQSQAVIVSLVRQLISRLSQ